MAQITVEQWRKDEGLKTLREFYSRLQELSVDSVCPALCDEGCEVEPDGTCEHGCPSVLLEAGVL